MKRPLKKAFDLARPTLALVLVCAFASGCRDKAAEAAERAAIETRIAAREARVAEVKKEATKRFEEKMLKIKPFDLVAARNRLVQEKFGIDLEETDLCSQAETKQFLEERAIAATNELYPPARRQQLVEQVAAELPMFKVGDQVAVSTRTNRGASGVIESINSTYVKIGRHQVLIKDITSPDPVCFDKEACEKQRRFIIHNNYDAPRRDELIRQRQRLLPEVMKECGYLLVDNKWRRVDEFFKPVIEPLVKKEEEAYWAEKKEEVRKTVETQLLAEGLLPLPPPVQNPYAEKE